MSERWAKDKRTISEQLTKNKHPTNALSARPPTRLTHPTCPTYPTRPTIAGAARTPTRLKPLSLPSPLKPPISFSLIINNLHTPVKK